MNVKFHLPGLRQNYPLNMLIVSLLQECPEYFREGVSIASFFGEFPISLWNGGRASKYDQCDNSYIRGVVKSANAQGIPIRYTFTNMALTEKDLSDPYCNFCMKIADNGMNGVIVVSQILEQYLREKYPNYKFNSSTCKELRTIERVNEELKKDYDLVVLDYNFNNQFELLDKIEDKERCEILVNAVCIPNCPRRGAHYQNVSRNQQAILKNQTLPKELQIPLEPWHCEYSGNNCIHTIQNYSTYVSPEDIWEKYVPMGFHNFKIEGRTDNLFAVVEAYCHYLIRPEYQGEIRVLLLRNLMANKVISINRPQPRRWVPEE